jgi:hypothetical protein
MKKLLILIIIPVTIFSCQTEKLPNVTLLCNPNALYIDSIGELQIDLYEVNSMKEAIQCSKELNKPILTVFGGWACMGDIKGIWQPFFQEEVREMIRREFIFTYLYVDDRTELADSLKGKIGFNGRELETVGDVNTNREIEKFKEVTIPIYTITDFNDSILIDLETRRTLSDDTSFLKFLQKGFNEFHKRH